MIDPLIILVVGIIVVVGCIIFLKLHPVISLLLAAIAVAILTPTVNIEQFHMAKGLSEIDAAKLLAEIYLCTLIRI